MGARLSKARKAELGPEAVAMSARGISYNQISKNLKVNRNTVSKLIEDELANRAEHREQDRERHLSVYDRIQQEAWALYDNCPDDRAQNKASALNTVLSAENSKVKITGAEAPKKWSDESPPRRFTLELGERTVEVVDGADEA